MKIAVTRTIEIDIIDFNPATDTLCDGQEEKLSKILQKDYRKQQLLFEYQDQKFGLSDKNTAEENVKTAYISNKLKNNL